MRLVFFTAALACTACEIDDWGPAALAHGDMSAEVRQLESGRRLYGSYCVGCHGEKGDGNGPAAAFLDPKPRDFRIGRLKFAAVASGDAPRDEDFMRVIASGLRGTAMPSFALLSEIERLSLVRYVRAFYPRAARDYPGAPVSAGSDPWRGNEEAGVVEGRKLYHQIAACWSCHPAYATRAEITRYAVDAGKPEPGLRPNLYVSESKESQWGAPIRAPDFLSDRVKSGIDVESLARVIASGVGGTAMPTWAGALDSRQLFGIAHYVRSLALMRGTHAAKELRAGLESQGGTP